MKRQQKLAQKIEKVSLLKGQFVLRSGQTATVYFDKYRFESSPLLLAEIVLHLKELIPADTEVLAGLELGGVPLAVALSLETCLPVVFVRKKAKDYGTKKITEGGSIQGKKVCVVEDVVTTGGQVLMSVRDMKKAGALIQTAICVIHRGQGTEAFEQEGLTLRPLFCWDKTLKMRKR